MRRRHVLRAHRRVRVLWRWVIGCKGLQIRPISAKELEIQPIRAVLPACNALHSIKGTAPSFRSVTGTNSTSICERTQCGAQRKHIRHLWWFRFECHFARAQSGDIRRWRHLSPCQSTNHSGAPSIQRAFGTVNNNNNIRYACTCLSPLRRRVSVIS